MKRTPWIQCSSTFKGQYGLQGKRLSINGWDLFVFEADLVIRLIESPMLQNSGFTSVTLISHHDRDATQLRNMEIPDGYGVLLDSTGTNLYVFIVPLTKE